MNAGDKAECREIGRVIVTEVLQVHINTCPHHTAYLISRARVVGIMFGVIIASGLSSGTVAAIIVKALIP